MDKNLPFQAIPKGRKKFRPNPSSMKPYHVNVQPEDKFENKGSTAVDNNISGNLLNPRKNDKINMQNNPASLKSKCCFNPVSSTKQTAMCNDKSPINPSIQLRTNKMSSVKSYSYPYINQKHHKIIKQYVEQFNKDNPEGEENFNGSQTSNFNENMEVSLLKEATKKSHVQNNTVIKFVINEKLQESENCKKMTNNWVLGQPALTDDYEMIVSPFKCVILRKFFFNKNILSKLLGELYTLPVNEKNNDMYKFRQSTDLQTVDLPYISTFYQTMLNGVRPILEQITGIKLLNKISMSFSQYKYSDVLLCHNDQLEGRRIAYVLYLTPNWTKSNGGTLDLFGVDDDHKPTTVVRQISSSRNTLLFFEVTKDSFHQVSEVIGKRNKRLSVNGWFYSEETDSKISYPPNPLYFSSPTSVEEDVLYSWINPIYLNEETHVGIKKDFEDNSEIALENFIISTKYEELCVALKTCSWKAIGPQNFCSYEVLETSHSIIEEYIQLMKSDAMFLILSQLTGLKLHHMYKSAEIEEDEIYQELESKVFTQVRKWTPGSYTMLRDDDLTSRKNFALDTTLFCNIPSDWSADYGGYVSYIAENENEELLTVMPEPNRLSLVYRDEETMKFTKYINTISRSAFPIGEEYFHELFCEYREDETMK